jgi:kynurenine formamidase
MIIRDLSQTLFEGMPVYPGDPPYESAPSLTFAVDGVNTRRLSFGSHVGTHVDAPRHFVAEGESVDAVSLDRFCGPAFLVDVPCIPGEPLRIPPESLAEIRTGDILILRTGWEREVGTMRYFTDCPRFAAEVPAQLLSRGIKALALDLPTVKSVGPSREMHHLLLGGGCVIVEGLVKLAAIVNRRVFFSAAPLKIAGGDGSPARAFVVDEPGLWN